MKKQLLEMFAKSTFTVSPQNYVYTKVSKIPPLSDHFLVAQDKDEITVVTEVSNINKLDILERNEHVWRLVSLNLETPFMAGTLAEVNTACAAQGLNNLVVSTYSKDYIFVKESQVENVKEVLLLLGFKEN